MSNAFSTCRWNYIEINESFLMGNHLESSLHLNARLKFLVDSILHPQNLSMEAMWSTTCLTKFANEDSPFPYKDAKLYGIINANLTINEVCQK